MVDAEGGSEVFTDPVYPPELPNDGWYRLTTTIPMGLASGMLEFAPAGLEVRITIDGKEAYSGSTAYQEAAYLLGAVKLPFAGEMCGQTLVMLCRPLHPYALVPPLLKHSTLLTVSTENFSYANSTGIPAGMIGMVLIVVCGVFLLTVRNRTPDYTLIALIVATAALMLHSLGVSQGAFFLEPWCSTLLSSTLWKWAIVISLLLYLALCCRRSGLSRLVGWCVLISAFVLSGSLAFSAYTGGQLARAAQGIAMQVRFGNYDGLLFWLNTWLMLVSALLAIVTGVRSIANAQAKGHALALREQLAMDTYHIMTEKLRNMAVLRHESGHQLTVLSALYRQGDMKALGEELTRLTAQYAARVPTHYSENFVMDAILHITHAKAAAAEIALEATVLVPPKLAIAESDLCCLMMNMLDNAVEANLTVTGSRFIRLRAELAGTFLAICCENAYTGPLDVDEAGMPRTSKPETELHGFGLQQMQEIAGKYGSMLDISFTDDVFTVRTALCLPETR